jgi:polyisoprenoid-binding protein YceI
MVGLRLGGGLLALTAGLVHAEPVTYTIDPQHTVTQYELGSIQSGRFEQHSGSIQLDLQAKTGLADVNIAAASVRSGVAFIDSILQSAELFNASQYPTIHFTGAQFVFNGDTLTEVGGSLTLLGKTLPVVLHVTHFACTVPPAPEACSGSFETTIDRTDYGMDMGVSWGLPKAVHLLVQVEAVRPPVADALLIQ